MLDASEISRVASIEPCRVRVRRGGDQQVHHPRSWLTTGEDHGGGELSVTQRDRVVDGQGV